MVKIENVYCHKCRFTKPSESFGINICNECDIEIVQRISALETALYNIKKYISELDKDDYDDPYEMRVTISAIHSALKTINDRIKKGIT